MLLLCIADIHGAKGLQAALDASPEADTVVVAGDITHLGGAGEAEAVLAPLLGSGRRVFAVSGNMDRDGVRSFLIERGIDLHGRGVMAGEVGFLGLGGGNPSPFGTPFEVSPAEAKRLLEQGNADISNAAVRVLVSHAPPRGTKLDRSFAGMHVGSEAVRAFIETAKPDLCICGHIHESTGEDTLGGTHCVNVGPLKDGRYALVSIQGRESKVDWRHL